MASSLSVTTQLTENNQVEILAEVVSGGTLPRDIFIYENRGTTELGNYIGVCDLEEYQRLSTFTGTVIPGFGNKFVKYTQAKILLDVTDDINRVINNITNTATFLSFSLSNSASTTQIINIP
jgi:hypothetical protein